MDEKGGATKSRLKDLLEIFDQKKLTPSVAQEIQSALAGEGIRTIPALSTLVGRLWGSSMVVVERDEPDVIAVRPVETFEINRAGVAVTLAGAALMVAAVFLPRVESTRFLRVQENTLIQSGDGWIFIVLAVIATAAVWRAVQQQQKTAAVLIVGLIAIGAAIYEGTGDRMKLGGSNLLGEPLSETANPGIGIYAAGAGGLLTALGGGWIAGFSFGAGGQAVPSRRTKTCPDCAETVLADARVCKHCGYRFPEQQTART